MWDRSEFKNRTEQNGLCLSTVRTEPVPEGINEYITDELLQEMHAFRERSLEAAR